MARLSIAQAYFLTVVVGIPANQRVTAVSIAMAESGLEVLAVGRNGPTAGCPFGSRDRGLWQINDCYHPNISDAQAFSELGNAQAMAQVSSQGRNWNPWSTYQSGAYRIFERAVIQAIGQPAAAAAPFSMVDAIRQRVGAGVNPFKATIDVMGIIFGQVSAALTGGSSAPVDLSGGNF